MIRLPLAWTLLIVSLWTSGLAKTVQPETINIRYPDLFSTETVDCDCVEACDTVYWYRSISNPSRIQFLGKCNNADSTSYGAGVEKARFKFSRKTSSMSFTLRIINVTEKDAGVYSCVLRDKKNIEIWRPGVPLRPGASAPTLPPKTKPKPPIKSVCRCPKKKSSQTDGCSSLILWPLVGLIAAVALALICVLYYFSRLPKKCRHRFVKKR
uniref:T cell surface glycoprotein CD8 beta n=1 Tax=Lutjanus sanguineus TaxID=264213 RepID=A0A0A7CD66_9TELE|nr:T cell surface glycoprotein CD8 beta [Lutjanus sanguineus]